MGSNRISVLDCTLRDGGYINNWEFHDEVQVKIGQALSDSGCEYIELGYLKAAETKLNDTTLFKSLKLADKLSEKVSAEKTLLMINYGEYDVKTLSAKTTNVNIEGFRLVFRKKEWREALEDARSLHDKGYKVFIQPMQTINYEDRELLELLEECNKSNFHAVYIVDSFGQMTKEEFIRLYHLYKHNLNSKIRIGFHSHNNLQLSYSLAMEFCEISRGRNIIIDSSCFGIGRGAGNLNSELIMNYLNNEYEKNYNVDSILEIIDDYLLGIYERKRWGFSIEYFLSAVYKCHPNYANFLLKKKTLKMTSIKQILSDLDRDKRNKFDENYIAKNYNLFNKTKLKTDEVLTSIEEFKEKDILLIAPGNEVYKNLEKIQHFIKQKKLVVISINHQLNSLKSDYVFYSNEKRYYEFGEKEETNLIISSNLDIKKPRVKKISYSHFLEKTLSKTDNSGLMAINLLIDSNVGNIYLAGFDGLKYDEKNYIHNQSYKKLTRSEINKKNEMLQEEFKAINEKKRLNFITPTIYNEKIKKRILGVIPARYKSSRLPGKPLVKINGIEMIRRTYQQCLKSEVLNEVIVATDDIKIKEFCESKNMNVIMTSESCLTGTDRVAEVAEKLDYDLYINIQGDEPVIDPKSFEDIVSSYDKHREEYIAYNGYKKIIEESEVHSETIPKVIFNENKELMYMSRLGVPFNKGAIKRDYFKQVCVYGFSKQALKVFSDHKKTLNERHEDIEILRFLDLGFKVKMIELEYDSIAVDVKEDVFKVEKFLNENNLD